MTLLFLGTVILALLTIGILYLLFKSIKSCRRCVESTRKKIFFNYLLRSVLEKSLEMALASLIRMYTMAFNDWKESLSTIYAFF